MFNIAQDRQSKSPGSPPNVLFISFDDLNHYVGFLGRHPNAQTPNLDRLAGRSMVFERAYCQAPICNPSRASLMTGLLPSTTGVYGNRQPFRFSEAAADVKTLPQVLRSHGYRATGSGKITHGIYPDPPSWDSYHPNLWKQLEESPKPATVPLHGIEGLGNLDWGPLDVDDSEMPDTQVVDYCMEQLRHPPKEPFFLACGFSKPHLEWYLPRHWFEEAESLRPQVAEVLENELQGIGEAGRNFVNPKALEILKKTGRWEEAVGAYLACHRFVDWQIGRLLDALDQSPAAANTIVVLWADHGWHLGEKCHFRKSTLWEEATRVPFLISAPGLAPGRCESPVGLIDLYPTLLDLCGLPQADGLEGRSLRPLLENPGSEWDHPTPTRRSRCQASLLKY